MQIKSQNFQDDKTRNEWKIIDRLYIDITILCKFRFLVAGMASGPSVNVFLLAVIGITIQHITSVLLREV